MAGMSARPGTDPHRAQVGREAWLRLAACAAAAALLQMDGTIVTVALPSVGRELDVGSHTASWILTAYFEPTSSSRPTDGSATDRKSTRLNSSHRCISYAVFCLKKKKDNI